MATELDRLFVTLEADLSNYQAGLKRAGADLDTFTRDSETKSTRAGRAIEGISRNASATAQAIEGARDAMARLSSTDSGDRIAQGFARSTRAAQDFERAANSAAAAGARAVGNDNRRGLSADQSRNLGYQAFDVYTSYAGGMPAGLIASQQGPQVLQALMMSEGGLKGGIKDLGATAASLLTPFTLATTAVVGFGAAVTAAAVAAGQDRATLEKSLQGIGAASGATVSQLDALARSNAEAGKVSASTSREIAASYAATGQFALPVIDSLTRATSEYARITGQEVAAATAELGRMFADPARGADDLAAKIGGLDDRTRQLIQTQVEQGDKSAAQQTLAESLKASIEANAAATGGWAQRWNEATAAALGYWEAAKRIAGIKLGIAPEGAQEAVDRLNGEIEKTNRIRQFSGLQPLGLGDKQVRERDAAAVIADTERRIAEGRAAEARAESASITAGKIAGAVDPNYARLSELRKQQSDLRDALADPLARSKLSDQRQTEDAYLAVTRGIGSMTDATGKMISAEELAKRQDQLRIDSLNAKTDAEKKAVAERQKAFELIGKTILPSDERGRIERAGTIAGIQSAKSGSKTADEIDDYDRGLRRVEDQIRRADEQAQTYGQGAAAAAKFRTEQELLVAAKRSDREITPELTAQIEAYGAKSAEAAGHLEQVRQTSQQSFALQSFAGNSVIDVLDRIGERGQTVAGIINDLAKSFTRAALQATIMGQGPFAGLFGTAAAPGSNMAGGLIGSLFGAFSAPTPIMGEAGGFGEVLS